MNEQEQVRKAEQFLQLHRDPELLVLPNVWDPLGARLLQGMGFRAVATASAAVAFSLGCDDGQQLPFDEMLDAIRRVATAADVPVSADLEAGYATEPQAVADNVRRALHAGAVGINLEDGMIHRPGLSPVDEQCERIRAVRAMADREGIPLVINARTDVFLQPPTASNDARLAETIRRAKAYVDAGANCIYPILVDDLAMLREIRAATDAPLNVLALASTPRKRELEAAGINRLSLGPGLIRASLTAMRAVANDLLQGAGYERFAVDAMTSDEIRSLLRAPGAR